jgi:hypothetical protein
MHSFGHPQAPAVAQDQRVDRNEQSITGHDVARNGRLNQIVDRQMLGGSLFGRTGTESSCFCSRIGAQDADHAIASGITSAVQCSFSDIRVPEFPSTRRGTGPTVIGQNHGQ